ncbi:MAG TPA: helix-turn-helix domain-containing protein [Polyangiaceae bacterium]|nr:helix-turn-helix domain-containing protein [Polyangiaceae bacterium]
MPRSKTLSDEQVLDAAARVLLRLGPARFTLADVAAEAGLAPATLLQRFGSKRGLLLAFARSAAASARMPFELARREKSSPLAALQLALVSACSELSSRQEVANSLALLLDDLTDEDMRAAAVAHARATESSIRELLDAAVTAGELRKTDTVELALSVQAAFNGALIQWALRGSGKFDSFLGRVLAPLLPRQGKKRES